MMDNMYITDRQRTILSSVVDEYINSAQPVSSKFLEKKYDFGICPASIRIEMQKLTDEGFLCQPHTSAGRVPTDKGYRFFVDALLEKDSFNEEDLFKLNSFLKEQIEDSIKFIQLLVKDLSLFASNLTFAYLPQEKLFWKEGWETIIQEPEFKEEKFSSHFTELLKTLEREIENFDIDSGVEVFIGKENPFSRAREFSIIASKYQLPKEDGILAIIGPTRMNYKKNIGSLHSLAKILDDL